MEVGFEKPEVVVRDFVIDQTSPIEEVLVEFEKDGFDYRYTVGLDRIAVNVLSPASDTNHERTQTATKQWLHSDRLGSTVNSTDSFGRVTERTDYNEWGEITYHAPIQNTLGYRSISTDRTYTNHDYDVVLGLYYAKARMYDAGDKRFTQEDPSFDGLNWYAYCDNNPTVYIDFTGRFKAGEILKRDSSDNDSADVRMLQIRLNELNRYDSKLKGKLDAGSPDGIFGEKTEKAVNAYKDRYLPQGNTEKSGNRGKVGATTWQKLGLPFEGGNNETSVSYIIYDPYIFDDSKRTYSGYDYVQRIENDIHAQFKNDVIIKMPLTSASQFIDNWEQLPQDINCVVLVTHGSNKSFTFKNLTEEGRVYVNDINNLSNRNINYMMTMGCNQATIGDKSPTHAFSQKDGILKVAGATASVYWEPTAFGNLKVSVANHDYDKKGNPTEAEYDKDKYYFIAYGSEGTKQLGNKYDFKKLLKPANKKSRGK